MKDETNLEVERMLSGGMEMISKRELMMRAEKCGYKIDPSTSFNYTNGANLHTYKARSVGWRHAASGIRFSHVSAPRDTLPELQEIRHNCFVFERGRIWEL
jgi:hypothetical protein